MSLTNTQRQKIVELISLSAVARTISNRVDPSLAASADIAELKRTLADMDERIAGLVEQLDEAQHPEAVFTDEEAHDFMVSLTNIIRPMNYRIVVTSYGPDYLRPLPKNIRVLVCTVLLNVFQERGLTPLNVWNSAVASNGALN